MHKKTVEADACDEAAAFLKELRTNDGWIQIIVLYADHQGADTEFGEVYQQLKREVLIAVDSLSSALKLDTKDAMVKAGAIWVKCMMSYTTASNSWTGLRPGGHDALNQAVASGLRYLFESAKKIAPREEMETCIRSLKELAETCGCEPAFVREVSAFLLSLGDENAVSSLETDVDTASFDLPKAKHFLETCVSTST